MLDHLLQQSKSQKQQEQKQPRMDIVDTEW